MSIVHLVAGPYYLDLREQLAEGELPTGERFVVSLSMTGGGLLVEFPARKRAWRLRLQDAVDAALAAEAELAGTGSAQ